MGTFDTATGGPPEKTRLRLGFIPLTDCASVVMAFELGLFRKYGLEVSVSREASWAALRDKLILGELDAAHLLYGLVYGVHLGIGGPQKDMAVLMGLNHNGQAITLSNRLAEQGAADGASLKRLIDRRQREYRFAQTFPTGTHAMWLYYWLAAHGIDPLADVRAIVVPPPQMVARMRAGDMDGFCAGEPWNARAIADGVGFTAITSQGIWRDHPEKVLGTTLEFVGRYPNTTRALIAAVLEASRYVDARGNRERVAAVIGDARYVDAPPALIAGRLRGDYQDGRGRRWQDPDCIRFFAGGEVNFPYPSHGMWFLSQLRRWGLLRQEIDYRALAERVNQTALYSEVARALHVAVPETSLKTETLFDGRVFDPSRIADYISGFDIKS